MRSRFDYEDNLYDFTNDLTTKQGCPTTITVVHWHHALSISVDVGQSLIDEYRGVLIHRFIDRRRPRSLPLKETRPFLNVKHRRGSIPITSLCHFVAHFVTRHSPNVGLMLGCRRRRRPNIKPALGEHLVFSLRGLTSLTPPHRPRVIPPVN